MSDASAGAVDKCPHCGGQNGVFFDEVVVYRVYMDWDRESYSASEYQRTVRIPKTARCCDCNRRVLMPRGMHRHGSVR